MRPPVEFTRIDAGSEQDLARWCARLDATPEQVKAAIHAVGPVAQAVEQYLLSTGRKSPP